MTKLPEPIPVEMIPVNQITVANPRIEPPRVYRRVKLSKDEPYDTTQTYPVLYG